MVIGRVIDSQIVGDHLYITDLEGLSYIVRLEEVKHFVPVRALPVNRPMRALQVIG